MPRNDLIRSLKKLHKQMLPALKFANLSLEKFDSIIAGDGHDEATLEIYLSQVNALCVHDGAYHEYMLIYGLKDPEWWINMELLGETKLREHLLLRTASKRLRAEWKKFNGKTSSKKKSPKQNSATEVASGI